MTKHNDKSTMTLRLPKDLDVWLVEEAYKFGIAKNAMIVMYLQKARTNTSETADG